MERDKKASKQVSEEEAALGLGADLGELIGTPLPHPYPMPEYVSGLYIVGDGELLPAGSTIRLIESYQRPGNYSFYVSFYLEKHDKRKLTVKEYLNWLMDILNLPEIEEPIWKTPATNQARLAEEAEYGYKYGYNGVMNRRLFEVFYEMIASSAYVQVVEDVQIKYILRALEGEELEKALNVYYTMFPWDGEVTLGPDGEVTFGYKATSGQQDKTKLSVRGVIDRDGEALGFITYYPLAFFYCTEQAWTAFKFVSEPQW